MKRAYWNLVSAISTVEARRSVLQSAQELVRVNTVKVDVGQSPPLDLVAAQAEVAADQEQLIIAETAVSDIEDELRTLIFDTTDRSVWSVRIEPIDSPPPAAASPDLDAAISTALRDRADLARVRKDIEQAGLTVKLMEISSCPTSGVNASYVASGLGGTQLLRAGGFPGTIVGPGVATGFGSVLNQLLDQRLPDMDRGPQRQLPARAGDRTGQSRAREAGAPAGRATAEGRRVACGTAGP